MRVIDWTLLAEIFDAQRTKRALMQFADNAGPDQPVNFARLQN